MVAQELEQQRARVHKRSKMTEENTEQKQEKKEKIEAKPLPVDKEKAKEIEQQMAKTKEGRKETKTETVVEAKTEAREENAETKPELKEEKTESKTESKEEKKEEKKETKKKKDEKPKVKKYEAVTNGSALPISRKQGKYICAFIVNKKIDTAISDLGQVILMKRAIPFKGEIPHRKGMMSGRYPIKASSFFINLLKSLKGNAIVNGLELEKVRISSASASGATRPMRAGGRSAKRTNIILKAKEISGSKK